MTFKYQISFILCFITFLSNAQDFRLGKVSKAELEESFHPADTSAVAAILYKKGNTRFELDSETEFILVTEVEVRLKIYKKEGLDYANFSMPYYTGGKKETLLFDDAATFNLVNGKVERTKIKKEGEFEEKMSDNWSRKKIVLPNVKEGSVVEFKYVYKTPYLNSIPDWYFQYEIPVNSIEYSVYIPQYYIYRTSLNSTEIGIQQETKAIQKGVTTATTTSYGTKNLGATQTGSISYNEVRTFYTAKNLPALKQEEYVNNIQNYVASVKHDLVRIQYPNNQKDYSISWEDLAKTIYDNPDFGKELNQKSYFEDDLSPILTTGMSRDEKINTVLNFVKNKVVWNENYGYYCKDGVKKAYKNKSGNVAEINLMLTAMLRYAGLNANPVLVSTRSNGIAVFPNLNAFNYVIAAVETENDLILLDATSAFSAPDIIPVRTLNWMGRLIRENKTTVDVDLMPKTLSRDVISLIGKMEETGEISAKMRRNHFDYNAFLFRENYNGISEDSYLENLEKRYSGIEIEDDYSRSNFDDLSKAVVENFSFKSNNAVDIIADKIYFSPMWFFKRTKNPFVQEERTYPIDFVFPHHDKYNLTYTIPEGYEIESIPESIHLMFGDNMGSFKFLLSNTETQIQLVVDFTINTAIVSELHYQELKDFFKKIVEKQNEKVVLKKK
ncbi:MAG: DUF3857 domain-containing protein [Flavobacteriaceae bacterium]